MLPIRIDKTVKRTLSVDDSTHVGSLMVSNADNGEWVTITITPTAAQKAALSAGSSFAQYVGPAGEVTFAGSTGDGTKDGDREQSDHNGRAQRHHQQHNAELLRRGRCTTTLPETWQMLTIPRQ